MVSWCDVGLPCVVEDIVGVMLVYPCCTGCCWCHVGLPVVYRMLLVSCWFTRGVQDAGGVMVSCWFML